MPLSISVIGCQTLVQGVKSLKGMGVGVEAARRDAGYTGYMIALVECASRLR